MKNMKGVRIINKYINPPLNENGRSFVQEGYITDILTDYAVRWLKKARRKALLRVSLA